MLRINELLAKYLCLCCTLQLFSMEQPDQLQLTDLPLPEAETQHIASFLSRHDFLNFFLVCKAIKSKLTNQLVDRKKYYDFPTDHDWTFDISELKFNPSTDDDEVFKEQAEACIAANAKDNFGVKISFQYASLDAVENGRGTRTSRFLAFLLARLTQLNNHILSVNLEYNCFTDLPQELFQMPRLRSLDLSFNPLAYKLHMFKGLPELYYLGLNFTKLPQHPISLFDGNKLGIVGLKYSEIKKLPFEFFKDVKHLECIALENNPLETIDSKIETLTGLERICIPKEKYSLLKGTLPTFLAMKDYEGIKFYNPKSRSYEKIKASRFVTPCLSIEEHQLQDGFSYIQILA